MEVNTRQSKAPAILPVPGDVQRPLWSVMIPTYNCAIYLGQALESVLAQYPRPDVMQIEVVDDCSTKDDPEAVVHNVGNDRVAFYRKSRNEGAVANFNTCIQRSRGKLIHILHGDDYVLPGFYSKIECEAEARPDIAAFFVRCKIVDEDGTLDSITDRMDYLLRPTQTPRDLLYGNNIRTPGAVIRRDFYERHGGFLPQLVHVADWEMWVRAISQAGGLLINDLLAVYRNFPANDSGRLARTAENLRDYLRLADIFEARFAEFDRVRFKYMVSSMAFFQAQHFAKIGDLEAAAANKKMWRSHTPLLRIWVSQLRSLLIGLTVY